MRTPIRLLIALITVLCAFGGMTHVAQANGCITPAAGTSGDPFLISTVGNLNCLYANDAYYWHHGYHFRQTTDLDMSAQGAWTHGIGDATLPFDGEYDGASHTISGLTIAAPGAGSLEVGLFGESTGSIHDLTFSGSVSATSTGGSAIVGGLVGFAGNGSITNAAFLGTVSGSGSTQAIVGGLIGSNQAAVATSYSTATVTATSGSGSATAGGLVGFIRGPSVANSFAQGNASATGSTGSAAGGLVGDLWRGNVSTSFSTGVATATTTGGTADMGGISGSANTSWASQLYWDRTTSGISTGSGDGNSAEMFGRTSDQMHQYSTFSAGWSITNGWNPGAGSPWGICNGENYPFLYAFTTSMPSSTCTGSGNAPIRATTLDANGGSCSSTTLFAPDTSWLWLPTGTQCTRSGYSLLGWSTTAQFPVTLAASQVARGWGAIDDTFDGMRMIFIPVGGSTQISGDSILHALWSPSS